MYCLKKIFAAEILALIGGICTGLMLVLAAITVSSVENADAGGTLIGGLGLVVFAFVGLVIFIIALIFNMIGLNAASKDDPDGAGKQFKTALFCIIGSLLYIILTIVQYIVYLSVLSKAKKVFAES